MSANATDIATTLRTLNGLIATVEQVLTTANTVVAQLATALDTESAFDPCELFTLSQAEARTGIRRRTLNEMVLDGRLPGVNITPNSQRATWQIQRADLEEFIRTHRTTLRR